MSPVIDVSFSPQNSTVERNRHWNHLNKGCFHTRDDQSHAIMCSLRYNVARTHKHTHTHTHSSMSFAFYAYEMHLTIFSAKPYFFSFCSISFLTILVKRNKKERKKVITIRETEQNSKLILSLNHRLLFCLPLCLLPSSFLFHFQLPLFDLPASLI